MNVLERPRVESIRDKAARRARKWLWQMLCARPGKRSRPVFIVGSGGCGSTMLAEQLWQSWAVTRYDGNHPAAYDRWKLKDLDAIARLVRSSKAPVTLFKPMLDAYRTRTILDRFRDARIVFVVRGLDDVIQSSLRRFGAHNRIGHVRSWMRDDFGEFRSAPPPPRARERVRRYWSDNTTPETGVALYWLFYNGLYYDLELDRHPRARLVQYERVIADPSHEIALLAEFVHIPFDEHMLRGIRNDSLNTAPQYALPAAVRRDCELLWHRLCRSAIASMPAKRAALEVPPGATDSAPSAT